MPLSWSSIGTVISSSTSLEELPSAIGLDLDLRRRELGEDVDLGLRDLGDTRAPSGGGDEDDQPAEPQARPDDAAHQRDLPAPQWLPAMSELGAVDLGGPDRDTGVPARRPVGAGTPGRPSIRSTPDRRPEEGQRLGDRVDPRLALAVVDQRRVRERPSASPAAMRVAVSRPIRCRALAGEVTRWTSLCPRPPRPVGARGWRSVSTSSAGRRSRPRSARQAGAIDRRAIRRRSCRTRSVGRGCVGWHGVLPVPPGRCLARRRPALQQVVVGVPAPGVARTSAQPQVQRRAARTG